MAQINRTRLAALLERERADYEAQNSGSRAVFDAGRHLFGQVPMTWMNHWSGGFPVALDRAWGNRIVDVDGNERIDFALGDTGAMAGHSPQPTVEAIVRRAGALGGITTMLPTEDAEWVANNLSQRFGMDRWSFSLSATDANRWALRLARLVTRRPKVLVFSYSYHGSVDETFVVVGDDGQPRSRTGNVAPAVDPTETTRVVEFNDVEALARELSHGDVAVVLCEPAMTNIGIVLPEPGFLDDLRRVTTETGTLLMIDETHTISMGWGGATKAWGLEPDIVTVGKALGGGIACGAYGLSAQLWPKIEAVVGEGADIVDVGGVGGTLAGNALCLAAMRATLDEVLTPEAFETMIDLATRFTEGVNEVLAETGVPWSVAQLGCRSEYRFCSPAPRNGGEAAKAHDGELDEFMHLFLANRGVLITPFHNMALMCPTTTIEDVDRHSALFRAAVIELVG